MAQHDYNIANQSGADFRSDLNNALSAIASTNSGDTSPTTTFANQLWIDTANNVLKIRNEGNSAWITTGISITADNTFNIDGGTVNGITALSFSSGSSVTTILDEDNLGSNSATALATQQSIKAYVDSQVGSVDTLAEILTNGNTTGGTDISLSSSDITGTGNINITGTIQSSGNITGTLATAAQPNITSVGTLTTLTVDDITINASSISDAGDLTIDVGGDLNFDADGGDIFLKDGGTAFGKFVQNSSNFHVVATVQDKDIKFFGNDGGSSVTALTLDMSDAGKAIFNAGATFGSTSDSQTIVSIISSTTGESELRLGDTDSDAGSVAYTNSNDTLTFRAAAANRMSLNSTGLDVTGTVTADGLNSSDNITITKNSSSAPATLTLDCSDTTLVTDQVFGVINFEHSDSSDAGVAAKIQSVSDFNTGVARLEFFTGSPTSLTKAMQIKNSGDISFYEDTGTTQALFWDASAESLGIGVTNPSRKLTVSESSQYAMNTLNPTSTAGNKSGIAFHGLNSASLTQFYAGISANFDNTAGGAQSGSLIFETINSNSISERMRIDSSGNVGIGETSPLVPLHISRDSASGENIAFLLDNNNTTAGNEIGLLFRSAVGSTNTDFQITGIANGANDMDLTFASDGGTERMRIDSSGNVGIGTDSPSSKLDVAGNIGSTGTISSTSVLNCNGSGSTDSQVNIGVGRNANGYAFLDLIGDTTYTDYGLRIIRNNSGANTTSVIQHRGTGTLGLLTQEAAAIQFSTNSSERMRIDSSGNVGIGTTVSDGNLHVSSGSAGTVTASTDANELVLEATANVGMTLLTGNSSIARIRFGDADSNARGNIFYNHANDSLGIQTAASTAMTISSAGNVTITGSISKGSGSFKIDHPLEYKKDTHHLVHSFVEAPQADNIYRGKSELVNGTVSINIDEYVGMTEGTFVALNREIQVFTSNETDWDAVKGNVTGNTLTITSQNTESNAEVSWLVIGERQDDNIYESDLTDNNGKIIIEPTK